MDFHDYKERVFRTIGAAMSVHAELGWGLLEAIYSEALQIELDERHIPYAKEELLNCYYKGNKLEKTYKADFVIDNNIIIELKSVEALNSAHRFQLFNYLRLTKKPIGILMNFGEKSLTSERYGYNLITNECRLLDANMSIIPKTK